MLALDPSADFSNLDDKNTTNVQSTRSNSNQKKTSKDALILKVSLELPMN